jgi:hypothetical protein
MMLPALQQLIERLYDLSGDNPVDDDRTTGPLLWVSHSLSTGSVTDQHRSARCCGRAVDDKTNADQHKGVVVHNPQHLLPPLPFLSLSFMYKTGQCS